MNNKNNIDFKNISLNELYINRELSWLDFNARVLELASNPTLPILEKLNFLAIFASNLDEFFMVRVAGLIRRYQSGIEFYSSDGLSARRQLEFVRKRATELQVQHSNIFQEIQLKNLKEHNISFLKWHELNPSDKEKLKNIFDKEIFPILTPLAVDLAHPFPYISGLSVNIGVRLINKEGKKLFARIKIPNNVSRFIEVNVDENTYIPVEEIISAHLNQLFPGLRIIEDQTFRITRNADFKVSEDKDENLLKALERELARRRFGMPVRLEVKDQISDEMLEIIQKELDVTDKEVVKIPGFLDLSDLFEIYNKIDDPSLKYPNFIPTTNPAFRGINSGKSIFDSIKNEDILVHHPYESFSTSVQEFIENAAEDPNVLAIKQTLYRTSGDSPIVDALIKAAEAGKQVVTLVEVQARFDEENNISWARKLERAGVHVAYGIVGLKTHCKVSLVVRRERNSIKRYTHIGTGNYNPKTARIYEDFGLFTANEQICEDVSELFNSLTGYSDSQHYQNILVAPITLREKILEKIQGEIDAKKEGKGSGIRIKLNSIVDEKIINALYEASNAGVKIEILVRSICSLRSGIKGLSENIKVKSILGRFLEHSRVYNFRSNNEFLIGSSDMMHRNLDRRIEVLVEVKDPSLKNKLDKTLSLALNKNIKGWELTPENTWHLNNEAKLDFQFEIEKIYHV